MSAAGRLDRMSVLSRFQYIPRRHYETIRSLDNFICPDFDRIVFRLQISLYKRTKRQPLCRSGHRPASGDTFPFVPGAGICATLCPCPLSRHRFLFEYARRKPPNTRFRPHYFFDDTKRTGWNQSTGNRRQFRHIAVSLRFRRQFARLDHARSGNRTTPPASRRFSADNGPAKYGNQHDLGRFFQFLASNHRR